MAGNHPRNPYHGGAHSSSWISGNQTQFAEVSRGDVSQGELSLETLKQKFYGAVEEQVIDLIWQESDSPSSALEALEAIDCRPKNDTKVVTSSWSNIVSYNSSQPFVVEKQYASKTIFKEKGIVDIVSEKIERGDRILILMRGVSGSGKSHLASQMRGGGVVLSTDDFFINAQGKYVFSPIRLSEAHQWNHRRAEQEMRNGANPVIIDNTNLEAWEMQPYICMAIRFNYVVELVEPETSWKYDVRTLVYKTRHNVPKDKIRMMLEKVRNPVDINQLVEDCRIKMNRNQHMEASVLQQTVIREQVQTTDMAKEELPVASPSRNIKPQRNSDRWSQMNGQTATDGRSNSGGEWEASPWDEPCASASAGPLEPRTRWMSPPKSLNAFENVSSSFNDVAVQTSNSDASLRTLFARNRDINEFETGAAPAVKRISGSSKVTLEKSCMTDEISEDFIKKKGKLATLRSYFAAADPQHLEDHLDKCQGDLDWAVGLLIDSGYQLDPGGGIVDNHEDFGEDESEQSNLESAEETPVTEESEVETNDQVSSPADATSSSESQGEVEALRRHVQDCFVLTDTISDQARRICGKDYNQFRASQLQKSRQPPPNTLMQEFVPSGLDEAGRTVESPLPSSASSSTEESELAKMEEENDAMVPFVMDPTFAQHLSSLFGQPNITGRLPQQHMSFEIPWALAEQIYLHWVSHVMDQSEDQEEEKEQYRELDTENAELKDIIDFEYAMQRAQEEKNAERQQLRDSMATKLSLAKLHDTYPNVDRLALDALFEENNYNYDHTITILEAWLGDTQISNVKNEPQATGGVKPRRPVAVATTEPALMLSKTGARDLRSEAFMYNKLRQEYQVKAQQNYQRGMSSVAAYYASESRRYLELYKEANQKAALQIVEEKNANRDDRTIDLHELKVAEALSCLESFIVQSIRADATSIQVITGKGNHSADGRPKIKPAVVTFLKRKKYGYEQVNPGCLRVYLRKPSVR